MIDDTSQKNTERESTKEEILSQIREEIREIKETNSSKWSVSNIFFVIFTLIIGGIIGYFFDYITEIRHREEYKLVVATNIGPNLTEWEPYIKEKVAVIYDTGLGKKMPVSSYFHIQTRILNDGNKRFDNLLLRFKTNKDLYLIKSPKFKIYPYKERPYLSVKQNLINASYEDEWVISELRPGEYIDFSFLAVSDKIISNPRFTVAPKEPKDKVYEVVFRQEITPGKKKRKNFLEKKFEEFTGLDFAKIVLIAELPIIYIIMVFFILYGRYSRRRYFINRVFGEIERL